jgi:hypothetical protein
MKHPRARLGALILLAAISVGCPILAGGAGLHWPENQLLPNFSAPIPGLDCIDLRAASGAEIDLFASLQGIVNRTQPQIACANGREEEGRLTRLDLHKVFSS